MSHAANAAAVLILRGGCLDLDGVPHAHQSCPEDMALWAVLALQDARREIDRLTGLLAAEPLDAASLAPTDDLVACGDHGPDRMSCELSAGHDPRCVHRDGERIWISVDQEIVLVPR